MDLSRMHPRQAAILQEVPEQDRWAVLDRAHLLQNLTGGILSGALWQARQEYQRIGAEALLARSRADNHAAMRSCGCAACARDADRLR